MKRLTLSKDVEEHMIAHWNAANPHCFYTHDEIIDYYQAAGYDLNWRQHRPKYCDWPGSRIIYTLPENQVTFFLLKYGS